MPTDPKIWLEFKINDQLQAALIKLIGKPVTLQTREIILEKVIGVINKHLWQLDSYYLEFRIDGSALIHLNRKP